MIVYAAAIQKNVLVKVFVILCAVFYMLQSIIERKKSVISKIRGN